MAAQDRSRQKKLEKHKKKRELAKRQARQRSGAMPAGVAALVRLAQKGPFGPTWISADLSETESEVPSLVTVLVTRKLPDGWLLPETVLVDRTCLGVKNGFLMPPTSEVALADKVAIMEAGGIDLVPCDPLLAQSVVFHAVDYARSLGFEPHKDFEPGLLEPRPAELLATPWAKPEMPLYLAGPHDNEAWILRQLDAAVGRDNYVHASASEELLGWADELAEEDEDDDGLLLEPLPDRTSTD